MNRKTIKCLFALVLALALVVSVFPQTQAKAASSNTLVRTNEQLKTALKTAEDLKIVIKTDREENFTIKGNFPDKKITTSSPNASISVNGNIASLDIKAANNVILGAKAAVSTVKITSPDNLTVKLKAGSSVDNLKIVGSDNANTDSSIKITNNGNIGNIRVNDENSQVSVVNNNSIGKILLAEATDLSVSGKTDSVTPVTIKKTAAGSSLTLSTNAKISAYADIALDLLKGAGNTSIIAQNEGINLDVSNNTKKAISIKDKASGFSTTVEKGATMSGEDIKNSVSSELAKTENLKKTAAENATKKGDGDEIPEEKAKNREGEHSYVDPTPVPPSTTTHDEIEASLDFYGILFPCTVSRTKVNGRLTEAVWTVSEDDFLEAYNSSDLSDHMTREKLLEERGHGPYLMEKDTYSYANNQLELTMIVYNCSESFKLSATTLRYHSVTPNLDTDTPYYQEIIEYNLSGVPERASIQEITADGRKETTITYQKNGTADEIASGSCNKTESIKEYKNSMAIPFKTTKNMWKYDSENLEKTEIVELTFEGDKISKKTVTRYTYDASNNASIFGINTYTYNPSCDCTSTAIDNNWSSLEELSDFKNNKPNMPKSKICRKNGTGKVSESTLEYNSDGTLSKDTTTLCIDEKTEVTEYRYDGNKKIVTKTTYYGASTMDDDMISKCISTYDLTGGKEKLKEEKVTQYVLTGTSFYDYTVTTTTYVYEENCKRSEDVGYKKVDDGNDKIMYSDYVVSDWEDNPITIYESTYHEQTDCLDPVHEYQKNVTYGDDRELYCSETFYEYTFDDNLFYRTKDVYYYDSLDKYNSNDPNSWTYHLASASFSFNKYSGWDESYFEEHDKNGSYLGMTNIYVLRKKEEKNNINQFYDYLGYIPQVSCDIVFPVWRIVTTTTSNDGNNPNYYVETLTDRFNYIYSEKRYIQYGESTDKALIYQFSLTPYGCYDDSSIPTIHEITEYELDENYAQTMKTVKHYENGQLTTTTNYISNLDGGWDETP